MGMPNITLNKGVKIPQVGLGTWMIKDEKECRQAVKWAIEAGYRHFDTAQIYENEEFVGEALRGSGVTRKDLFITTKIWNDNQWWDDLIPSLDESLGKLQTDYIDLLLLHFPVTETRGPAWRKMEEAFKFGKAKSIGVSNYTVKHLEELQGQCEVRPTVNQVELHVFLQQPELAAYCEKNKIAIEAYSPLAHGYGLDDPVLQSIAKRHTKSAAQIMLRWCLQQGWIILPKSVHKDRIADNLKVLDFELDSEDLLKIKGLDKNYRTCWDPTHVP